MNRIICCVLLLALALTACGGADFDGSRLGNESELTMEFKTLNREDEQNLTIGEGEHLHAEISVEKGSLSVVIEKDDEAPVYEDGDLKGDLVFDVAPEAGTYTVHVDGRKARGSVSFTVEPSE
jgi:hypothetical protein